MTIPGPDSLDRLPHAELIALVRELIDEVKRAENEKLSGALARLKVDYQAVKDELARLKGLPPRPPHKPSGMDKATDRGGKAAEHKLAPSQEQAQTLRARFDRIFKRRTGYATLDRLLRRLFHRKDELLRVLDRPEIPLNSNASENDVRAFVIKRKISGGTVSDKCREACDVMLGLVKTCMKLKVSFCRYLGASLGVVGRQIPPLASLIRPAPHD
jgi:Transposase IS66 family